MTITTDTAGNVGSAFVMMVLVSGKAGAESARYNPCASLDAADLAQWRTCPDNAQAEKIRRIIFRVA